MKGSGVSAGERQLEVLTSEGWDIHKPGTNWEYRIGAELGLTVSTSKCTTVYAPGHWLRIRVVAP